MALHLARSDGGEGGREEGDHQVVLPVVLLIGNQPILRGGKVEARDLPPDKVHFGLGPRLWNRK